MTSIYSLLYLLIQENVLYSQFQTFNCTFVFFFFPCTLKKKYSKVKIELSYSSRTNTWFGLGHPFLCSRCDQSFTTIFPSSLAIVLLTALLGVWPSLLWRLLLINGNNLTKQATKTWELQLRTNTLRRNPFIFPFFIRLTNFSNLFIHKQRKKEA